MLQHCIEVTYSNNTVEIFNIASRDADTLSKWLIEKKVVKVRFFDKKVITPPRSIGGITFEYKINYSNYFLSSKNLNNLNNK